MMSVILKQRLKKVHNDKKKYNEYMNTYFDKASKYNKQSHDIYTGDGVPPARWPSV